MERVRSVFFGLLLALGLLCCPVTALAGEIDYLGSFGNGLDTLKGDPLTESVTPEEDFNEQYSPREEELQLVRSESDEEVDIIQKLKVFVVNLSFEMGGTTYYIWVYSAVRDLLKNYVLPVAVLFVFFWWGLRKSLKVLMNGFRKGKVTT